MLVERDGKISTFQKEKYFNVHIGKGDLTADLEKVKTKEEAKRIAAACEKKQAVVSSLKRETKTVNPPKLYDLTTLQREANRYYGFTAQQTLDLVQTLYEKKLLTYPRTDSQMCIRDRIKDADINPLRNKRDVWKINTVPFKGGHYAAYPPKLVETCLLAGCPEGGIVLDPFMGSGTTGMVASQMGLHFVGVEPVSYTHLDVYKRQAHGGG